MKLRSLVCFVGACCAFLSSVHGDEYDTLRLKWREMLVGPASYTPSAARTAQLNLLATTAVSNGTTRDTVNGTGLWDKLNTAPTRTYLWADADMTALPTDITTSFSRLRSLALAWATPGCALQGNTALRDDIIAGLDWLNANYYNAGSAQDGNWWDWDIGCSIPLDDATILLYDELTATQIDNYMAAINHCIAQPEGEGANLIWTAKATGLRAIIKRIPTQMVKMKDAINTALAYTSAGDGFHSDGSFIQHDTIPYNGSYGLSCINDIFEEMYLLNGSTWAANGANVPHAYTILYNSFEPLIHRGEMMDMVRGREISRYNSTSHNVGRSALKAFLRASQMAPSTDAAYYKRLIKHWLLADTTFANTYAGLSIPYISLAEAIVGDSAIVARADLDGYYQFPAMDRAVKFGAGWAAGVAMHSTRIKNYESINQENLKGWNTGFGMLYVYTPDLLQFSENFWPTVNQYRLPGTTTESGVSNPPQLASASFVGGVEAVDLQRGLSAMDVSPYGSTLRGRKAWFFLDNEIVCLGAGILASNNKNVITVVENRRLNASGNNAFLVNDAAAVTTLQTGTVTPVSLTGVNYAHLAGNVSGADLGYYFPDGANLLGLRESRTRQWTDINKTPNRLDYDALFTNNYLTLYYDHGLNPTAGLYSYAILPNFTAAQTQSYATNPQYTVLENSTAAQAVRDTVNPAIGAVFWQDAVKTVGTGTEAITSDKRAAVFVAFGSTTDVAISNPTQLSIGIVNLEIARSASGVVGSPDAGITVTQLSPTIKIAFAATGTKGQTRTVRFSSAAVPTEVIVDNTSAGATFTGSWAASTAQSGYYGTNYVHDYNAGATGGKKVTFTPNVTATGSYDVYVSWTIFSNRATNVPIDVVHSGGTTSFSVNQQTGTGGWHLLGTFSFAAGTGGSVAVRNDGANGYVVADAIRLTPH